MTDLTRVFQPIPTWLHVYWPITSSTGKHYSLDSEDDFLSGCLNVSHQQEFFSELLSPGRSHYTIANCFASLRSNYQNLPIAIAEFLPAFRCRKVLSLCLLLSTGTSLPPWWQNFLLFACCFWDSRRTGGRRSSPSGSCRSIFSIIVIRVSSSYHVFSKSFSLNTFGLFRLYIPFDCSHFYSPCFSFCKLVYHFLYNNQVNACALIIGQYYGLLYGQPHERAWWTKPCAVIGYPSGQDGAILPARDYPPRPARNILQKAI